MEGNSLLSVLHVSLGVLLALLLAGVLLWRSDLSARTQWTLGLLAAALWLAFASSARRRVPVTTMLSSSACPLA